MVACKTGATAAHGGSAARCGRWSNGAYGPWDRVTPREGTGHRAGFARPFLPCTTMISVGKLDTVVQQGASELLRRLTMSAMPAARHDGAPIRRSIHGAV